MGDRRRGAVHQRILLHRREAIRHRAAAVDPLVHAALGHIVRPFHRPAVHKIRVRRIDTAPALFALLTVHDRIQGELNLRGIQGCNLRQNVGHIHIHRRDFHRIVARTGAVDVVCRVTVSVSRFEVDPIPAVGELNTDIKLYRIATFTQPTDFSGLVAVAFAVSAQKGDARAGRRTVVIARQQFETRRERVQRILFHFGGLIVGFLIRRRYHLTIRQLHRRHPVGGTVGLVIAGSFRLVAQRLIGGNRIGMGITKKIMPHGLIRFAEHHDGVIAQRMVISADHVGLRAGMSGKRAGNQQRRES